MFEHLEGKVIEYTYCGSIFFVKDMSLYCYEG